jgi:hypothetical protein
MASTPRHQMQQQMDAGGTSGLTPLSAPPPKRQYKHRNQSTDSTPSSSSSSSSSTSTSAPPPKRGASARIQEEKLFGGRGRHNEEEKLFGGRGRHNEPLNQRAVALMQDWYKRHEDNPYPTKEQKDRMAAEGGITTMQVTHNLLCCFFFFFFSYQYQ